MSTVAPLLSPMGQAALIYARRGWPVFPCREKPETVTIRKAEGPVEKVMGAKSPYTAHGPKNATCDEREISRWWRRWPDAMIGLPMGNNGMFALDFDPRADAETGEVWTLDRLKAETEAQIGCALPISLASRTQSGGVHVFFRQPREGEPIRNRGNLPLHVDVRGQGGYVIAPPSRMAEEAGGGSYRWLQGRQDTDAVEAPEALILELRARKARAPANNAGDAPAGAAPSTSTPARPSGNDATQAAQRRYAMSAMDAELRKLVATPKGDRNNQINASAFVLGQLVGAGVLGQSMVRHSLRDVVDQMPDNRDPEGARQTIENGLTAGMAQPRDLSDVGQRQRSAPPRSSSAASPRAPHPGGDGQGKQSFRVEGSSGEGNTGAGGDDAGELHRRCIFKPHTDLGNAERFFERYGQDFRWSPALGWLGWDGRRWVTLDQDEKTVPPVVLDAVFKTVRSIQDEAKLIEASGGLRPKWLDAWEEGDEERKLSAFEMAELKLYRSADEAARKEADRRREEAVRSGMEIDPEDDPFASLNYIEEVKRGRAVTFSENHRIWGRKSEAAGKLGCIANLARPWMSVKADAFDADPLAINVMNGTLRFRRVREGDRWKGEWKLDPHTRDDLISKLAPIMFDPKAACPIYDATMAWAQKKAPVRRYLHQWGGLSMTGDMGEQKLHFWYGLGGNGKSTIMDAWCFCLGDYTTTVPIETFLDQGIKKRGDQASPDLARLGGVRLLRTSESERGSKLASALIKLVTGGEPFPVRFLNRGFFDLRPIFKMTVQGNFKPQVPDTDEGIWRRLKLIPWPENIDREPPNPDGSPRKDPELPKKLQGEASGIFNRLMDGLIDWLECGLVEPGDVTAATAEYRSESDPLARFLKLCTKPEPDTRIQSSRLHAVFVAWTKAAGEKEWTNKGFSQAMLDKGYEKKASDGMQWLGLKLIRDVGDFIDQHGNPIPFSLPEDGAAAPPDGDPRAPPDWGGLEEWPA